ncbi:MAG TPA: POTRA domain-containing protein [Bryobacteraceae bacterium]
MTLLRLAVVVLVAMNFAGAQSRRQRKPAAPAPAAAAKSDQTSWLLETLKVDGNKNYTPAQILAVAGLRIGQTVGEPEFEAARQRLEATGVFDRVGFRFTPAKDGKGIDGKFEVFEMGQMFPIRFEDLPVTDAQLRDLLKQKDPLFAPKIPATKRELDRYAQWITEFVAQPVIGKLTNEGSPDLMILFRPAKPKPSVARVIFKDTGDLPSGLLQTAMYGVAIGMVYGEPQFRLLLDTTIRPLYDAKGMIRVSFPKIETEPAKDVTGIVVTVQVEQGPIYKLGKVTIQGIDPDSLPKLANLTAGKPVNFDEAKAAQERIADTMHRTGYIQATSQVKRDVHDAEKTVDVTIAVTPGPQFAMGKLDIVNLDIETEPVIRKLWGLQPGKPFNTEYPQHFLDRVKEQGIFDNLKATRAETKVNQKENTVDVTLYFNK